MATATPLPKKPSAALGGVLRASGIVMALTLLSRLLGMLRESVIAGQFGVTIQTDAYNAAFKISDLLMYLIAGGALSSTFVPVFSEYLHQEKHKAAWKTFSIVATATFLVALTFVVVAEIWTPAFVRWTNFGYTPDRVALAVPLARIILPAQIFFMLGGLLQGTLNARGQFLIPALSASVYNLGIIFGALFLAPLGFGVSGMMWGGLGGAFIGAFALQLVPVRRLGMRFRPSLALGYPGAVKVWKLLLPILLGVSLPNVDQIINSAFASNLTPGAQSALSYANRVMLIPIGIFAQAMGIAILPALSALAAAGNHKEFKTTVNHGLRTIFFLTIPASALLYVLAEPIIVLIYQHGVFTANDTRYTAVPLRLYALGIFAWSAQAILTRAFYALQDSRTPVISGTILTAIFIGMNWFVVHKTGWGIAGLATATTIAAILHTLVMAVILRRRLNGMRDRLLLESLTKTVLATLALCVAAWLTRSAISALGLGDGLPKIQSLFTLTLAGLTGLGAFLLTARALKMSELQAVLNMVKRRKRVSS